MIRVEGYVAAPATFTDHSQVLNPASEELERRFGPAGKHTRIAVGAPSLPRNAPVEIVVWVELKER